MSESVQTLVDSIQAEGAIDLDDTAVLRVLDRRHKSMCAKAEAYRSVASAVVSVQASGLYTAPADLIRATHVNVGGVGGVGGVEYSAQRESDLIAAYGTNGIRIAGDGIYTRRVDALWIYPAVDAGVDVSVFGTYRPAALSLGGNVFVDDEALEGLMAGVFASLLMRPGEARPDLATPHEQVFAAACEEYRLRVIRRWSGGRAQIRVQGVNA